MIGEVNAPARYPCGFPEIPAKPEDRDKLVMRTMSCVPVARWPVQVDQISSP